MFQSRYFNIFFGFIQNRTKTNLSQASGIEVFGITSIQEWVLLQTKINFYEINHLDFGIILDSGMPFAADQLVFQNRGFTVVYIFTVPE